MRTRPVATGTGVGMKKPGRTVPGFSSVGMVFSEQEDQRRREGERGGDQRRPRDIPSFKASGPWCASKALATQVYPHCSLRQKHSGQRCPGQGVGWTII